MALYLIEKQADQGKAWRIMERHHPDEYPHLKKMWDARHSERT